MSEIDTSMVDKLMAEDASHVDLQSEFEAIIQLKQDLAGETGELEKEIALLRERIDSIAEPYMAAIQAHEETIKKEILECGKSFKCSFGQAVYRKGSRSVKWNDEALMGYSAAGHPEIEQFRTEMEGKPSVVLKIGGMA